MDRHLARNILFSLLAVGAYIAFDLIADRLSGITPGLDTPHLLLASTALLATLLLLARSSETHRRRELVLQEAMRRLELTQSAADVGSWDWDLKTGRLEWSPKTFELHGLDPATTFTSFDAWRSLILSDDREEAARRIARSLEEHLDLENEYRVLLPDGSIRWISALGRGTYDAQDQPIRLSGICLDITERRQIEASMRHLSSFPELNPNAVLEVSPEGVTFCNPAARNRLRGYGLDESGSAFLPDDWQAILAHLEEKREITFQREVQVGDAIFAESVHVIPAFHVARIYAFDITGRKQAEEAMRTSEEKYRLLFQNMAEGFALYELIYDEQGQAVDWRVLEVNDAYVVQTGISREQIQGRRISELFPAAIAEYLPRFAAVVATQTPEEFETFARAVNRYQRVSTFPAGGNRFASIIEDITKRKQSEEALRDAHVQMSLDAQRQSALEERQRLARELHDSVSQALYSIGLGINTALESFDTNLTRAREALTFTLSLTQAGMTEMRALIFELRPESLEQLGLVGALTRQAEAMRLRHSIPVELDMCSEPDAPFEVKEEVFRIAQEALQNVIKHARPKRLQITLACDGKFLELAVCDNGVGFDPEGVYPGHLGLRSMRERASRVGGKLEIASAVGFGAKILLSVPLQTASES